MSEELEDEAETQPEEEAAPEAGSDQTVAVRYGEAFSDCVLSERGDMLYDYGSTPGDNSLYIAEMPEEGQQLSWSCIELPDHMAIRQLTTDYQGKSGCFGSICKGTKVSDLLCHGSGWKFLF